MAGRPISDLDLSAYVDGHLDPARRAEVEAHLASHPEHAAWVEEALEQNRLIRELYGEAYHEPVPERIRAALESDPPSRLRPLVRVAAALVVLAATGVAGWWIGKSEGESEALEAFLAESAAAHLAALQPDAAGIELATLGDVQALSWLAEKTTFELRAPDLSELGLTLVARRVVAPSEGRAGAQLTYEDASGRTLTLYLRPRWSEHEPEFRLTDAQGFPTAYWVSGPLIHALTGDLPEADMLAVARAVHEAFEGAAPDMAPQLTPLLEAPAAIAEDESAALAPLGPRPAEAEVDEAPM